MTFDSSDNVRRPAEGCFATTHWSMVVMAATHRDTPRARDALSRLCQSYWYPLYGYVRRRGHSAHDAQDLTQAFFARLLERRWIDDADQQRGRFRTFLLTAMNHFLSDEWDKMRAQKRGGGVVHIPVQLDAAEARYGHEPVDHRTPDQYFERRWALTLLESVLQRLSQEYERDGKAKLFSVLSVGLIGDRETQPYPEMAACLEMNEGTVRVAVHRLRRRYRQILREEISQTTAAGADVDEEMRHLFSVLSNQ